LLSNLKQSSCNMQVALIDCNKATERSLGKLYKLKTDLKSETVAKCTMSSCWFLAEPLKFFYHVKLLY